MPGTAYYILAIKRASQTTWTHLPPLNREVVIVQKFRVQYVDIPGGTKEPIWKYPEGWTIDFSGDYYFPDEEAGLQFQYNIINLLATDEEYDVCATKHSADSLTQVCRKCFCERGIKFFGGKSLRWKQMSLELESRDPLYQTSAAIGGVPGPSPFEIWSGRGQTVAPISDGGA